MGLRRSSIELFGSDISIPPKSELFGGKVTHRPRPPFIPIIPLAHIRFDTHYHTRRSEDVLPFFSSCYPSSFFFLETFPVCP